MVPVDVLDQIERVGLEDGDYLSLQLGFVASVLDGLLDYSAPIAVFTKLEQVEFNDLKKTFFVVFFSALKDLLKDVIAKFILCELDALLEEGLEDCLLCVGLAVLDD